MTELLSTKLYIPRPRPNLVPRPRLTERLNAGLDRKLTLIAAPAGFGKTTLLSEWIPQSPRCVTWLSLDKGDNDPTQFWSYFIASLQQLRPDLGGDALALLQAPQALSITSILTALINDISSFPDTFACVLDDHHFIEFLPIHEALTFLIEHLPANIHLVITSRADPPLPLARLRANDHLTELRANDLRFTAQESTAFLNQIMGLSLSAGAIYDLEERTEGWIAGLQIAVLSMQGQDDIQGFIRAFSGSHRHILGYLAEEVLNQRPEGTLDFLLQTSILERMCGSLCDAVTGGSGGQMMLENLEHANLFLTPLDDVGKWFRYHHLFAEVLQARLRQNQPELLGELHGRASEWYEAHNAIAEAIQHALAAGNAMRAADLVERERWTLLGHGEINTLRRWLDMLPVEIVCNRPGLSLAYAWIFTILRQAEVVEPRLQEAEKALEANINKNLVLAEETHDAIRGEIATLRASDALSQSDPARAVELCQQALKLLQEDNLQMLAFATYFLGHGELRSGHVVEAERVYSRASSLGFQANNFLIALHALANVARVQIIMSRLSDAAETSQHILQITADYQKQGWPVAGVAFYGLGMVHYEWNDLQAAERYSRLGVESGQLGGLVGLELNSRKLLAFTLQAQNDSSGVDQVLRQIAAMSDRHHHPLDTAEAAAWEAHLRLMQGRTEQAFHWAETCGLSHEDAELPNAREAGYLTLTRVLIAQRQSEAVLELLGRLRQAAESDQRIGSLIEILMLQALARQSHGELSGAMVTLDRALKLAEPEGYMRTFVDEGEPIRLLLLDYQTLIKKKMSDGVDGESLRLLTYTDRLLAALSHLAHIEKPKHETTSEPLSDRELEILRLVAAGHTNKEIAEILVIALSTVKSHINHLYGKLDTHKRTQAVAIARDLGLLRE